MAKPQFLRRPTNVLKQEPQPEKEVDLRTKSSEETATELLAVRATPTVKKLLDDLGSELGVRQGGRRKIIEDALFDYYEKHKD